MGERLELLQEGKKRIATLQEQGFKKANLYGELEALPNKALSNGFVFRHETLRSAFEAIL